jgi:hypothetical protein
MIQNISRGLLISTGPGSKRRNIPRPECIGNVTSQLKTKIYILMGTRHRSDSFYKWSRCSSSCSMFTLCRPSSSCLI